MRNVRVVPSRKQIADMLRDVRTVPAPSLTIRERNRQLRSLARTYARGFVGEVES
jgi:hypothetical protein